MKDAISETLKTLQTDLTQIDSYPVITEAVIHHMKKWFRNKTTTFHTKLVQTVKLHKVLHQAIIEQFSIEWDNFIRGRITKPGPSFKPYTEPKKYPTHGLNYLSKNIKSKYYYLGGTKFFNIWRKQRKTTKEQERLSPTITNHYNTYKQIISLKSLPYR